MGLPECSKEVSLLCLLNESSDIAVLGQVLLDLNTQKLKLWDPLHKVSAYEKGLNGAP